MQKTLREGFKRIPIDMLKQGNGMKKFPNTGSNSVQAVSRVRSNEIASFSSLLPNGAKDLFWAERQVVGFSLLSARGENGRGGLRRAYSHDAKGEGQYREEDSTMQNKLGSYELIPVAGWRLHPRSNPTDSSCRRPCK